MFDTAQPQAGEPANQPVIEAADQDIGKESSSFSDDLGDGGEVAADEPFLTVRYNKEQKPLSYKGMNYDKIQGRLKEMAEKLSEYENGLRNGGQGEAMTPERIRKLEKDDSNYRRALASYNKNMSAGASVLGYDCSGLVVAYLLDNKLIDRDLTANGIFYTICDPISESGLRAGDLVFKKYLTSSKIYHCGVYMGDGSVVHAKGRDYGVVREPLSAAGWNRYGRLKMFAGGRSVPTLSRQLKRTSPTMRGDDVREVQQALTAKGFDPKGIDGSYGPNTQKAVIAFQKAAGIKVDGIVGPETWGKLMG